MFSGNRMAFGVELLYCQCLYLHTPMAIVVCGNGSCYAINCGEND